MRRSSKILFSLLILFPLAACLSLAQTSPTKPLFTPLDSWRAAVLAGDSSALANFYSKTPPPQIQTADANSFPVADEVAFWSAWRAKGLSGLNFEIAEEKDTPDGAHIIVTEAVLTVKSGSTSTKSYVPMAQAWLQQGNDWRIVFVQRHDATRLRQPLEQKDLYPATANAKTEISEVLQKTASNHKRVLLVFGGNWCYDCHVLEEAFHSPEIAPTLEKSFEVVHIDIGQADKNLDIAKKYEVPLEHGVPAIAVLESDGKLLFSHKSGEFEATRRMGPDDILTFLNKWKPTT